MDRIKLFTIGHSNLTLEKFLKLLRDNGITAIADVRSVPKSKYAFQFDKNNLESSLREIGCRYAFLGKELGGLRTEKECYSQGELNYEAVVALPVFQDGINRLRNGASKYRIVMMCTEKDPKECHRFHILSRFLRDEFEIQHILADGTRISQGDLENETKNGRDEIVRYQEFLPEPKLGTFGSE